MGGGEPHTTHSSQPRYLRLWDGHNCIFGKGFVLSFFSPLLEIINELIFVTNAMDVRNQDTGSVDRGRWPGVRDPGIFFLHVTHITLYL